MIKINEDLTDIKVFSDLHLDFDYNAKIKKNQFKPEIDLWKPISLDNDKNTTLILAGDIWHSKKGFNFMNYSWYKEICKNYKYVILVLGNHDYWGGNLNTELKKIKEEIENQKINNLFVLNNDFIDFNNFRVLGTTLWLDFNNKNSNVLNIYNAISSDKKYIRVGNNFSKIKDFNIFNEHVAARNFLKNNLSQEKENFIITHHPPTINALNDNDIDTINNKKHLISLNQKNFNDYYSLFLDFNYMEDFILNNNISYWIYGHSHECKNYKIGNTNLINNSRGYVGMNSNFDENFIINLKENNKKYKII